MLKNKQIILWASISSLPFYYRILLKLCSSSCLFKELIHAISSFVLDTKLDESKFVLVGRVSTKNMKLCSHKLTNIITDVINQKPRNAKTNIFSYWTLLIAI